jgi:hypothetical protein
VKEEAHFILWKDVISFYARLRSALDNKEELETKPLAVESHSVVVGKPHGLLPLMNHINFEYVSAFAS